MVVACIIAIGKKCADNCTFYNKNSCELTKGLHGKVTKLENGNRLEMCISLIDDVTTDKQIQSAVDRHAHDILQVARTPEEALDITVRIRQKVMNEVQK